MRFLILIFSFIPLYSLGQNYIHYHQTFNRVDEDVLCANYDLALVRLDSIYSNYDFIYAQDCMKSLQICCSIDDSIRANKWLEKAFKQGIPLWIIRTNELTKKALLYSNTKNTIQNFDSLYSIYKASINSNLANQIDSLFIIDQKYTRKVNDGFILFRHTIYGLRWIINNKKQFKIIENIIDEYGFPGEKLIGLPKSYEDSAANASYINFWGPYLRQWKAYFMLLHYFTTRQKVTDDFENKLFQNLVNGNLSPHQFARICDFMYSHKKKSEYVSYNSAYNTNTNNANRKRYAIGLNTLEQQHRNKLINRERRKNKKANSEIFLE